MILDKIRKAQPDVAALQARVAELEAQIKDLLNPPAAAPTAADNLAAAKAAMQAEKEQARNWRNNRASRLFNLAVESVIRIDDANRAGPEESELRYAVFADDFEQQLRNLATKYGFSTPGSLFKRAGVYLKSFS